uniref:Uncharacterized protein n=1 Tax=viral metagenome TaxID=1070528 RepID=A0A6M3JLE6_9ZZZZ
MIVDDKYCPQCGKQTLQFIEQCEAGEGEWKTSWACNCTRAIVYIYTWEEKD